MPAVSQQDARSPAQAQRSPLSHGARPRRSSARSPLLTVSFSFSFFCLCCACGFLWPCGCCLLLFRLTVTVEHEAQRGLEAAAFRLLRDRQTRLAVTRQ